MFFTRKATPEDFSDIAHIHFESWQSTYIDLLPESYISSKNDLIEKTEMWQHLMLHPDVIVWVAYDINHNNLGFIGYFANTEYYEITTLYVLSDHQGLGIGTQLMKVSLQAFLESDVNTHVCLWVLKDNVAAMNFYKKFGFVCNGEKSEECYKNTHIVDIKMVRKLDNSTP